jgi:hypothetical protein
MIHNQLIDSNTKATKYTEENGSQQELVIAACPVAMASRRDWRAMEMWSLGSKIEKLKCGTPAAVKKMEAGFFTARHQQKKNRRWTWKLLQRESTKAVHVWRHREIRVPDRVRLGEWVKSQAANRARVDWGKRELQPEQQGQERQSVQQKENEIWRGGRNQDPWIWPARPARENENASKMKSVKQNGREKIKLHWDWVSNCEKRERWTWAVN